MLTINPINDTPVAQDDNVETEQNVPIRIDVLENDFDVDNDSVIFRHSKHMRNMLCFNHCSIWKILNYPTKLRLNNDNNSIHTPIKFKSIKFSYTYCQKCHIIIPHAKLKP